MELRKRREELGLLQKDVAKTTKIPQSTLSKYETGVLQVRPKNMAKLAEALETDVQTLFFSEEQ